MSDKKLETLDDKYVKSYNKLIDHKVNFENSIVNLPSVKILDGFNVGVGISPSDKYEQQVIVTVRNTQSEDETNVGIKFHTEKGEVAKVEGSPSVDIKISNMYINIIKDVKENPQELLNNLNTYNGLAIDYIEAKKELDKERNANKVKAKSPSKKI